MRRDGYTACNACVKKKKGGRGRRSRGTKPVRDIHGKVLLYTTALDPISFSRLGQDMRAFISVGFRCCRKRRLEMYFSTKMGLPTSASVDGDRRNRWKYYGFV